MRVEVVPNGRVGDEDLLPTLLLCCPFQNLPRLTVLWFGQAFQKTLSSFNVESFLERVMLWYYLVLGRGPKRGRGVIYERAEKECEKRRRKSLMSEFLKGEVVSTSVYLCSKPKISVAAPYNGRSSLRHYPFCVFADKKSFAAN
eukprot:scaffold10821_cov199-Amphora_coffeaeformis.AAC.15